LFGKIIPKLQENFCIRQRYARLDQKFIPAADNLFTLLRFDFHLLIFPKNFTKIGGAINTAQAFFCQLYTKFCEVYQEIFSFCEKLVSQVSKYLVPMIEDLTDLGEKLPKKERMR
jgi:hypothetical protein